MPAIQVLMLAAGRGTRLRPLTLTVPKCLVPILGRPLLDYWIKLFERYESDLDLWVNVYHLKEPITTYLKGRNFKNIVIHVVEESALLGTGGTLKSLMPNFLNGRPLLLAHADNLTWFELGDFIDAYNSRPKGTEITMMTFRSDAPQACGIVKLDEKGVVQNFYEKVRNPPGNLASGAVFILSPVALSRINEMPAISDFSSDVIPKFLGEINTWENRCYHRDIGTPGDYDRASRDFEAIAAKFDLLDSQT